MTDAPLRDHFSDDDARRILRRATELEKQGVLSESDLREIAREANISQAALTRALSELRMSQPDAHSIPDAASTPSAPWYARPLSFRTIAWFIAACWLLAGILSAILD